MRLPRLREIATEAGEQAVRRIRGEWDRVNDARVRREARPDLGGRSVGSSHPVDIRLDEVGSRAQVAVGDDLRAQDPVRCRLRQTPRLRFELVASQRVEREAENEPS